MFPSSISKEEIRELPILKFEGKIHIVDSKQKIKEVRRTLQESEVLGFDTEKKPTFQKGQYHPTALVQLSTAEEAFLFRISNIGFHPLLKDILEDPDKIKVGISIKDDILELKKVDSFEAESFIDVNDIAAEMGIEREGVRNLSGIFLSRRISKGQQTSNWENPTLTYAQQSYAATDAWICLHIYEHLQKKGYLENGTT